MDYCDDLISCLGSHSDGTHSVQMDTLVGKLCNAKFLLIFSDEETNSSTSCMI